MIKKIVKKIIPEKILKLRRDFLSKKQDKRYSSMQIEDIFKEIYHKKLWTPEDDKRNNKFYSGIGSRHEEFTEVYIDKIKDLFWKKFIIKTTKQEKNKMQKFLQNNNLSSHMWIVCQK